MCSETRLCLLSVIFKGVFGKKVKEFTHAANNEFEALSVGIVLSQFAKRCLPFILTKIFWIF